MIKSVAAETDWTRLAEFIVQKTGLHFPGNRQTDLKRGFRQAGREFGFADDAECISWLLSHPTPDLHIQVLVRHLTVGETYLFRDPAMLDVLEKRILPALIRTRQGQGRHLRLWSAACCTGEEAYMLAIMLHRLLPDLRDWKVVLFGTDINQVFLDKARAGVFNDWSFRGAPAWLETYFHRQSDGLQVVVPEIRRMVQFSCLNLMDLEGASSAPLLHEMDLIVCRNVLMYLNPAHAQQVVSRLRLRMADGGWIVASPSEASRELFPRFKLANFPGAILFQKVQPEQDARPQNAAGSTGAGHVGSPVGERPRLAAPVPPGRPAAPVPPRMPQAPVPDSLESVKRLADQGQFEEALSSCNRFLEKDKLSTAGHFIRAAVLAEQGHPAAARASLRQALFLDRGFVMAHLALGNLARAEGNATEAAKCFANARRLLRHYSPETLLPESQLAAGELAAALASLSAGRVA